MIIISGTLPNRIKIIYVNSQAYLIIKDCESECFRIDSVVRKGRIMHSWFLNVYMDAHVKEAKM